MRMAGLLLLAMFLLAIPTFGQEEKRDEWPSSWPPELIGQVTSFMEAHPSSKGPEWRGKQCAILDSVKQLLDREKDSSLSSLGDKALGGLNTMSFACSFWLLADEQNRPDEGKKSERISVIFSAFQVHSMVLAAESLRARAKQLHALDDWLLLAKEYGNLGDSYDELVKKYNTLVGRYNQLQTLAETERMTNGIMQQIQQQLRAFPPPVSLHCTTTTINYAGGVQRSRITCY